MAAITGSLVIIGAGGYWGANLVRVAIEAFGVDNIIAHDINEASLTSLTEKLEQQHILDREHPLRSSSDLDALLADTDNRYFVVATPPQLHHSIALKILSHKRYIMITKPLTLSVHDAEEIGKCATEQGVLATVDHTFMFHPAVVAMIEQVKAGAIGSPKTFYANWLSRGKIQSGVDVIWDLAPHPLSILLEFMELPITISCEVLDTTNGFPTEASLSLTEQRTGNTAIINVSWMDGDKSRMFKIRGSHHSIIFDDTQDGEAKLRLKGGRTAGHPLLSGGYEGPILQLDYPEERPVTFAWEEPLKKELHNFIHDAMQADSAVSKSPADALRKSITCVKLIEAAEQSLQRATTDARSITVV